MENSHFKKQQQGSSLVLLVFILLVLGIAGFVWFRLQRTHNKALQTTTDVAKQPNSQNSSNKNLPSLSVNQLLNNKDSYLNKRVRVTGNIYFDQACPSSPAPNVCSATAYFVEPSRAAALPGDLTDQIRLYQNGSFVGCTVNYTHPQTCGTWIDGHSYEVTGTFKYLVVQGKTTQILILEVESSKAL